MANEAAKRLPTQFEAIRNAHGDFQANAFFNSALAPAATRLTFRYLGKTTTPNYTAKLRLLDKSGNELSVLNPPAVTVKLTEDQTKRLKVVEAQRRVQTPARPAQPTKLLPPSVRASAAPSPSTNGKPVPAGR